MSSFISEDYLPVFYSTINHRTNPSQEDFRRLLPRNQMDMTIKNSFISNHRTIQSTVIPLDRIVSTGLFLLRNQTIRENKLNMVESRVVFNEFILNN